MASNTLYPPVVNNTEPAFITYPTGTVVESSGELKVYFKFSAFNADYDKSNISVHATVHLKVGTSIVNIEDGKIIGDGTMAGTLRLRATQIILNLKPEQVSNSDLWYITLKNEDIKQQNTSGNYSGWVPGSIYKIQIRLSEVTCKTVEERANQQVWLYSNADRFSEWSTVIYTKCIGEPQLKTQGLSAYIFTQAAIPPLESIDYPQDLEGQILIDCATGEEHYESCSLKIYHEQNGDLKYELIEEATIYPGEISRDNFKYLVKYNFVDGEKYYVEFTFITENKYQPEDVYKCYFQYSINATHICNYKIVTIDKVNNLDNHSLVKKVKDGNKYYTSLGEENDNACIGLKIELDPEYSYLYDNINLRILRTDENSNFTVWEELKYINLKLRVTTILPDPTDPTYEAKVKEQTAEVIKLLERMPIIYDFTIESNIFYKYGLQSYLPSEDEWTRIKEINPIQRDFDYAYLLGKDQRQLKLKFNNTMNTFTPQVYDNNLEPIGSQFPYTFRNSKADYRTFPITGTITFEMDDGDTFLPNGTLDIFSSEAVRDLHREDRPYGRYDYGYERKFRKKVLDFLKDGTFKLFKSATEGDILVRLKDVNCTPNQQLSRLIYDFSANAVEVDNYNLDSLKKYGIIYPGTYVTNWENVPYIDIYEQEAEDYGLLHCHGFATSFVTPSFHREEVQTPTPDPVLPNEEEEGGE